jgi:hypothetical protein
MSGPGQPDETEAAVVPAVPDPPSPARPQRPILERIGMAAIAVVLAILFGGVAAAAWIGQELFLAIMAAIGCLMTVWVGGMTLFRG